MTVVRVIACPQEGKQSGELPRSDAYLVLGMELRRLRLFIAAAEHPSFRRAADNLDIAQLALSRQIATLEDELGLTAPSCCTRILPGGPLSRFSDIQKLVNIFATKSETRTSFAKPSRAYRAVL